MLCERLSVIEVLGQSEPGHSYAAEMEAPVNDPSRKTVGPVS